MKTETDLGNFDIGPLLNNTTNDDMASNDKKLVDLTAPYANNGIGKLVIASYSRPFDG